MICIAPIMSTKSQYRKAEMGMFVSLRVQYATVKCVFSLAWNVDSELALRTYEIYNAIPDVRSRHAERSLGCLSACPRHRETRSVGGPRRPCRLLAYAVGVRRCIRRNGSRQSLMRDESYFVLDALLDRQPVKRL